jgi:hypothetical protein
MLRSIHAKERQMPTLKNEVTQASQVAIVGISKKHHGVAGESQAAGAGVIGVSISGDGVSGFSESGNGVVGQGDAEVGVKGLSKTGRGVEGLSQTGEAVRGISDTGSGVSGTSSSGLGVAAQSDSASAVRAVSKSGRGVEGWSESSYGVSGDSASSAGVRGTSKLGRGVEGWSDRSEGVLGICESGTGVWGVAGRSPSFGKTHADAVTKALFEAGAAAKKYADAAKTVVPQVAPHPDPTPEPPPFEKKPQRMALSQTTASAPANSQPPPVGAMLSDVAHVADDISIGDLATIPFDDTAGIGVCGEHRGGGIGVKAISRAGMGVAAYSTDWEAIHAETHAPQVAAIAAYNLNPRGTGAALFAKKEGRLGHAGFFDGRVWIGGELGVGGDILLANADCAEDFDVVSLVLAEPGCVMVIGEDGVLHPCSAAYDKCVAGVISGAGQYKPGLILDKQPNSSSRSPVALLGKVCCKVTAENGPIKMGDLLTTSPLSGHAMKASDPARAFGAVIGKALRPHASGVGLIPILIALQ